jgi:hypothetical protein
METIALVVVVVILTLIVVRLFKKSKSGTPKAGGNSPVKENLDDRDNPDFYEQKND